VIAGKPICLYLSSACWHFEFHSAQESVAKSFAPG
jgi:hypothetical protein